MPRARDPKQSPPAVALPRYEAQLATLVKSAPAGDDWLHELKYDGYRLGASKRGTTVRLESRRGNDWTASFRELASAIAALPVRTLLVDGEVTALLPDGRTSFQALQSSIGAKKKPALAYFVFDVLHLDGEDLARLPLEDRKQRLAALLADAPQPTVLRYSEHVVGHGARVFEQACKLGAEGIVSKRRRDPYRGGRTTSWLKTKCVVRQELVVGGFTDPDGSRQGVGSMLVGYYTDDGRLAFAGKVGTGKGFGLKFWRELRGKLDALEQPRCPFDPKPAGWLGKHGHWVDPKLVVEVAFTEWTEGGQVRHPSLQGFRDDKPALEVRRERPAAAPLPAARPKRDGRVTVAGVSISTPDRVLYPALGFTKRDLAELYADIAPWILPHVRGRPLTLVRCEGGVTRPDGLRTECQFLRHTSGWHRWVPASVTRVQITEQRKQGEYLVIQSAADLIAISNGDIIELHAWNSTISQLECPDRVIFDLDPGPGVAFREVVAAAQVLRERLRESSLESWVRTTGGKGVHVTVPLEPVHSWDACFEYSRALASGLARSLPRVFTTSFGKAARAGKILIDYKRNHRAAVAIAAYSTRARPNGPVSLPMAWDDLAREKSADSTTVRNLRDKLAARTGDPWEAYGSCRQRLPPVGKARKPR